MNTASKNIEGIVTYPITPFDKEGRIDGETLATLVERLVSVGSNAIAPLGSTGESAYLNDDEWTQVADVTIKTVAGRLPVVVGVSDITTQNAVKRARIAESLGADVVMVLPASYWKLSDSELFSHYAAIAKAISIPIMVYNNPATSGIDMTPDLIYQMFKSIDNITMVKESTGDIQRMHKIAALSQGDLPFFNGSNPLALEAFSAGASGWCTAAPNIISDWPMKLYQAFKENDVARAREIFYRQLPILEFILKGGLPTTIKAGLTSQGLDVGFPRQPLSPLSPPLAKQLDDLLQAFAEPLSA